MRVLLTNPTVRFTKVSWEQLEVAEPIQAGPGYGLLSIAAVLAQRGHHVENLDPNVYDAWDQFVRELESCLTHIDLLGVSSYSPSSTADEQIIRLARRMRPDLLILFGGYFPTLRSDIALGTTEADIVIRGEADFATAEVVCRLDKMGARHPFGPEVREAIEGISGVRVRYFDIRGEHITPDTGKILLSSVELDNLPTPLWNIAPLEQYKRFWGSRYIDFSTSRSCDRRCPFCSIVDVGFRGAVRAMSPDVVLHRLVESVNMVPNLEYVFFADAHFTYSRQRTLEICKGLADYKRRGLLPADLSFGCETRVDTLYDDVLDAMQAAGWSQIWIGLESGSPATLKQYRKGQSVDQGRQAVRAVSQRGMTVIGFLMVAAPDSTVGDILATLDLAVFLLENGGDVTPDVSYCLISWEGTTQMKETRRKGWDLSYVVREFVKIDPVSGQEIRNLVAEGGYVLPQDLRTRYLIRAAYEHAMSWDSIHTSTFLAGLFLALRDLFGAFPETADEWKQVVAELYDRAIAIAQYRHHNEWGLPFNELLSLDLTFNDQPRRGASPLVARSG
jgi:anaerobic magnesium-protoporphyrin IX monomethyl ester cyclase